MEIGDALKRFRNEFNLTQKQVAEKIAIVPQQWQKYEYKQMMPSAEIIVKLVDAFNVSADYLLGKSDEPRPAPSRKADEELMSAIIAYRSAQKTFDNFLASRGI